MLPLFFTQSKKFSELIYKGEKYEFLGNTPNLGRRINFLSITLDLFFCEEEPKVEPVKGIHVVTWHVPKDKDVYENLKKEGWYGPFGKYIPITNPTPFIDAQDPEYFKKWSKRKQVYRHAWLRQMENKELEVVESNMDTFLEHYLTSSLPKKVKKFNQNQMKELQEIYKENMLFVLVKDTNLNKVVAGLCILLDQEINQVIKQYSFMDKTYKSIGTGMIDLCITYARQHGLKFVNLTLINTYGHGDKSWKGFTAFKLEFNPIIIYFRQSYFKITMRKILRILI
jgi:hypothetical protein